MNTSPNPDNESANPIDSDDEMNTSPNPDNESANPRDSDDEMKTSPNPDNESANPSDSDDEMDTSSDSGDSVPEVSPDIQNAIYKDLLKYDRLSDRVEELKNISDTANKIVNGVPITHEESEK